MTYLNALVAVLAALGLVVSAIGWRHSLRRWDGAEPEAWFALAKVLYAVAIGTRILLWDFVFGPWRRLDRESAMAFAEAFGGTDINLVTSLIALAGIYASLRARHLLIPMPERERWAWYSSWKHPSWRLFR